MVLGGAAGAGIHQLLTRTREFKTSSEGVSDLLAWESVVEEGVIAQTDGALLCAWSYQGADMESATVHERNVLSYHLNAAIMPFTDGWMFHVDAVRRPASTYAEGGHFPDAVTRLIDEERRRTYQGHRAQEGRGGGFYETDYVIVATFLPSTGTYDQIGRFFVKGREEVQEEIDEIVANFRRQTDTIEARLGAHLRLRRLSTEDLLRHLHFCLTGEGHPVSEPPASISLNAYLADQQVFGGFSPRVGPVEGGRHIRAVSVQGFPNATAQGMLDMLHNFPGTYRWSTRLIMLSDPVASKMIKGRQLQWFKKRRGLGAQVRQIAGKETSAAQQKNEEEFFMDEAATDMTRDASKAIKRIGAATECYAIYTSTLVVMNEDGDEADRTAAGLRKLLVQSGFPARFEDVNAFEAFLGSLPGNGWANRRRLIVHSRNVSDLIPATKIWAGAEFCASHLFPEESPALMWTATDGATPFRVNLHSTGDVGHTLVVGATGAGKSVLVNSLLAQWNRYERAQVFLFDVGYSGYLLSKAVGGQHYGLSSDRNEALRLQPLAHIDDPNELMWASGWVETLLELSGVEVTPERRTAIGKGLKILSNDPVEMRTLSSLRIQVQDAGVREALQEFCKGGTYGHILDGDRDTFADEGQDGARRASYQVFELSQVRELSQAVFIPLLLYLFRLVERRLSADRPTVIVLEEVWSALMESAFARRIKQWLLTLRKQNAAVILVAHTPAQIAELDNREVILDSCPTKIYLPNPEALDPESMKLYRSMGLNEREVRIIGKATRKKHYFYKCPVGSRLFDLDLGPLALSFVTPPGGMSSERLRERVEGMEREHGPGWVYHWLRENGLPSWAEEYAGYAGHAEAGHAEAGHADEQAGRGGDGVSDAPATLGRPTTLGREQGEVELAVPQHAQRCQDVQSGGEGQAEGGAS